MARGTARALRGISPAVLGCFAFFEISLLLVSCPGDNESVDRSACARSVEPCADFRDIRQRNAAYEITGTAY